MSKRFATDTQITHGARAWLYALTVIVLLYLIIPILIIIPVSFSNSSFLAFPPREPSLRWYVNFFESPVWQRAAFVSLVVAFMTTIVSTVIGVAAAYALNRMSPRWRTLMFGFFVVPQVVPIILIAIGSFFLYAKLGLLNTYYGLVLAHSSLAIPFVIITVRAGLQQYDMNQELAAQALGATRWRAFFSVTLPQIRGPVLNGVLFSFITSLDEVVVSIFLSTAEKSTLTRLMFNSLREQLDPTIAAVSTLLIALSLSIVVVSLIFGSDRPKKR